MAQNTLPRQSGALLVLTGKCEAGLTAYATPLNITQITAASLAADAAALSTAMGDFNATRATRTAAHAQRPPQPKTIAKPTFFTVSQLPSAACNPTSFGRSASSACRWASGDAALTLTSCARCGKP